MVATLKQFRNIFFICLIGSVLTACGGGGGGSSSDSSAGSPSPTNPVPGSPNSPNEPNDGPIITPTVNSKIELSWNAPSAYENGTSILSDELAGFEIAYRRVGDSLFSTVQVQNPSTLNYDIDGLDTGIYEVKVAAFDINGLYSGYSEVYFVPVLKDS